MVSSTLIVIAETHIRVFARRRHTDRQLLFSLLFCTTSDLGADGWADAVQPRLLGPVLELGAGATGVCGLALARWADRVLITGIVNRERGVFDKRCVSEGGVFKGVCQGVCANGCRGRRSACDGVFLVSSCNRRSLGWFQLPVLFNPSPFS